MKVCAVGGCKSESYIGCGRSFHRFPDDENVRNKWIEAMPSAKKIAKYSVVCGLHFRNEDYVTQAKRILKPHAVPSIFFQLQDPKRLLIRREFPPNSGQMKHFVINDGDNVDDADDVTSEPQIFSWQKDTNVNYDLNLLSGNTANNYEEDDLHEIYKCGSCTEQINGFRYACVQCVNYELCSACEGGAAHAHHYLLRVPRPSPYVETQQVMDTIRRILAADIKSFQTEAHYVNSCLDDTKSVVSEVRCDPFTEEPELPIPNNDSSHVKIVEVCSYSNPRPNRSIIITSHVPKKPMAVSTLQTHSEKVEIVQDTDIDWLDENILEECEIPHQSYDILENIGEPDLNEQHWVPIKSVERETFKNKKLSTQLKPAKRKLNKLDNRVSPSNATGKVSKRMVYGVVNLPKKAPNSTDVIKMLKAIKHSLESKVCINMERLSDDYIKLATNSQ